MADEASDTVGGAMRIFLGTAGFVSFLIGAEILREGGPAWVGASLIAAAFPIYLSPAAWKFVVSRFGRNDVKLSLSYLSDRDSSLGPAIIRMARNSAWGRWYAAQQLVATGSPIDQLHLYQIAASVVMEKILDGDLVVRGRRRNPNRLDYEVIPPTDWHSSWLHFLRDPIVLWKMHVVPRGGVEINPDGTMRASDNTAAHRTSLLDYDSLIVDAYQFETLWPKTDALADKKRRKFLRQAWWRGLNKDERRRLS